jgi:hypothetical protein
MSKSLKLDYWNDLALGEKAVRDFKAGKSLDYIAQNDAVFLNTRPVAFGLNVTDLGIAATLAGLNQLYVGDSGTGKSQFVQDQYNYYFGGNKKDSGEAIKIRGYQLTENNLADLVFQELNLEKATWDLTDNVNATFYAVDEINRAPTIKQNDCFELGDGKLNHKGADVSIGREGYHAMIATANIGNGDFGGTFDIDKAMYNRLAIALDFDYKNFSLTREDKNMMNLLREANPNLKSAPRKNIVDKIIAAQKEISKKTTDLGLEARGVLSFLNQGLMNCTKDDTPVEKHTKWHIQDIKCQDCNLNSEAPGKYSICSMVKEPVGRTLESTRKYAAAIEYLAKLKDPSIKLNPTEVMFKAFELAGAYQSLLNPTILHGKYYTENPEMMGDVVEELKADYKKNEERIIATLDAAEKGMNYKNLVYINSEKAGVKGQVHEDSKEIKEQEKEIRERDSNAVIDRERFVFNNRDVLDYSWVPGLAGTIKLEEDMRKLREKNGE